MDSPWIGIAATIITMAVGFYASTSYTKGYFTKWFESLTDDINRHDVDIAKIQKEHREDIELIRAEHQADRKEINHTVRFVDTCNQMHDGLKTRVQRLEVVANGKLGVEK